MTDGNYEASCTIPNGLENVTYLSQIQVDDNLGNVVFPSGPTIILNGSSVVAAPNVTPGESSVNATGVPFTVKR